MENVEIYETEMYNIFGEIVLISVDGKVLFENGKIKKIPDWEKATTRLEKMGYRF